MEETYGIIYLATNKVNGKVYVGQTTTSLRKRWKWHCNSVGYSKNYSYQFVNALRKHGVDNFTCKQIDVARDQEELDRLEMFHIAMYQSYTDKSKGYNSTVGGRPTKCTPERAEKISKTHKKRFEDPEVLAAHIARRNDPVHQAKWLETKLSNPEKHAEHMEKLHAGSRGKKRTPEVVEKTASKLRGRKMSEEQRLFLVGISQDPDLKERARQMGKENAGRKMTAEELLGHGSRMQAMWDKKHAEGLSPEEKQTRSDASARGWVTRKAHVALTKALHLETSAAVGAKLDHSGAQPESYSSENVDSKPSELLSEVA